MVKARKRERRRLPRARGNCRHFEGVLAGCSRNGMTGLEAAHQVLVLQSEKVVCSVNLDACRLAAEPEAPRWDYVLVIGSGDGMGIGLDVHPAAATQVQSMVNKKNWADALLHRECENLRVKAWAWVVPNGDEPLFTPNHPQARVLAEAGISFPARALKID